LPQLDQLHSSLQVFWSWFLLFPSFLLISTHAQQSWLAKATADRFRFSQCAEDRTWPQLASTYSSDTMKSGGLGTLSSDAFEEWACFAHHPCLSVVSHTRGDMMCYVFNEAEGSWYPWCLRSELVSCSTANATSKSNPATSFEMQPPNHIWSSTQRGHQDTGYVPNRDHPAHTLIMALRFPTSGELFPSQDFFSTNRQWVLSYGVGQHWIWHGASEYIYPDSNSVIFQKLLWNTGRHGAGPNIHALNMGNIRAEKDQIQGGKVLTLCAVTHPDGQYVFYLNGTSPQNYTMDVGMSYETDTVQMDFSYQSSLISVGTGYDLDFQGIIHETRLYNYSLTAQEVKYLTDEMSALYS
jgi:hypothetical protein